MPASRTVEVVELVLAVAAERDSAVAVEPAQVLVDRVAGGLAADLEALEAARVPAWVVPVMELARAVVAGMEVDLADLVVDPEEEGLVSAAGVQGRAVPVCVAGAHRSPESG